MSEWICRSKLGHWYNNRGTTAKKVATVPSEDSNQTGHPSSPTSLLLDEPHHEKHYANMSVQYAAIFHGCKNDNFQMKIFDIFLIFAQNIDCGYTLEPPQRGGSNEYPQSMFWSKNKKNMYTRVNPTFSI